MGTFLSLKPPTVSSTTSLHMISIVHLDDSPNSLSLSGVDKSPPTEESMPLM